ncbi:hypothetical protein [Paraburkholderia eburnea]|uniref:hypothetical protein n=1 Tax=Paraburkholderia eburnea TaxID=1189126 RepID=UPI0011B0AC3D|nr:hypothetical protein [Paraburkholderia eburnea]
MDTPDSSFDRDGLKDRTRAHDARGASDADDNECGDECGDEGSNTTRATRAARGVLRLFAQAAWASITRR